MSVFSVCKLIRFIYLYLALLQDLLTIYYLFVYKKFTKTSICLRIYATKVNLKAMFSTVIPQNNRGLIKILCT